MSVKLVGGNLTFLDRKTFIPNLKIKINNTPTQHSANTFGQSF